MSTRALQRKRSRALRAALGARGRKQASHAICRQLRASLIYRRARHIAFHWPLAEEVDLRELLGAALREGKRCYLPVMRRDGRLRFVRFRAGTTLMRAAHGIMEPASRRPRDQLPPTLLSLVFVPLLAFDRHGTRIGSGGGFYDRTFAFKSGDAQRLPRLVGVAFACQEVTRLSREAWDVPLACVATDRELIRCA